MPVALVGGNEFREACHPMDQALLASLGDAPRVAILPTAAAHQRPQLAANNGMRYFTDLGAEPFSVMLLTQGDAADSTLLSELKAADMVYLTGGDPQYLLKTLQDTLAHDHLASFVADGGLLVGSSAGAMVLCQQTRTRLTGEWQAGLNIVPEVAVLPHHDEFDLGPAVLVRQGLPRSIAVLGIDTATAALWYQGQWDVRGTGQVTIYAYKGTAVHASGESFTL